jgi:hypothetical protein
MKDGVELAHHAYPIEETYVVGTGVLFMLSTTQKTSRISQSKN